MGGNSFFEEQGVDIYGHHLIVKQEQDIRDVIQDFNLCNLSPVRRQRNEGAILFSKTWISNPTQKIFADMMMDLGDLDVQIILTPGHTETNLSVYVPSEGVLFCGDCLVDRFLPNLEAGARREWEALGRALDKIDAIAPTIVVPGHGDIIRGQDNIKGEIDRMKKILNEAIKTGIAPTANPTWE